MKKEAKTIKKKIPVKKPVKKVIEKIIEEPIIKNNDPETLMENAVIHDTRKHFDSLDDIFQFERSISLKIEKILDKYNITKIELMKTLEILSKLSNTYPKTIDELYKHKKVYKTLYLIVGELFEN